MQSTELRGLSLANLLQSPEASTLNLNVLRRIIPDIDQVLACANHVALYDFDRNQHKWVRKEIEGSFFLIEKTLSPFHQIIILNKKNADNFVEDIVPDLGFELTLPYIMYRNKADEVIGVWFYEEEEAKKVAQLLQQITEQSKSAGLAGQMERSQSASKITAAMPADSIGKVSKAIQRDEEDGFWDKSTDEPAAERTSAHLLQHFNEPPNLLDSKGTQEAHLGGRRLLSHHNTLEKLFAKMKVPDSFAIHASQPQTASVSHRETTEISETGTALPEDGLGFYEAAPPPNAPRPALLTPKFLAEAKVQPIMVAASSKVAKMQFMTQPIDTSDVPMESALPLEQDDSSLTRARRSTSTQRGRPLSDAGLARHRLRRAITALSQSNAFIDVLAEELSSAGLFD